MEPKVAFQNIANLTEWSVQRGGIEMAKVVVLHESLLVIAKALGIELAPVESLEPAPSNE